jgi:hypothetical protein
MDTWDIDTSFVDDWLGTLPRRVLSRVLAALSQLQTRGPHLGRPYVDTIKSSKIKNLKELRPLTTATHAIRIRFVFNRHRRVVLLAAGNMAGKWSTWYREHISIAERNYDSYSKER